MRFLSSQRTRKPRPHHYRLPGRGKPAAMRTGRHLRLEPLEERTVLSGGVVTTSVTDSDVVYDSFLQQDDEIVVAVQANENGDDPDFAVLRYQADGTLDPTFADDGIAITDVSKWGDGAYAAVPYSDGKILLAGYADPSRKYTPSLDVALARYNSDGSMDETFGSNGEVRTNLGTPGRINDVMLQPDEKIVVAGYFQDGSGKQQFTLARFTATGELDPGFGNDGGVVQTAVSEGHDRANAVTMHQGKILAVGETNNSDIALVRYNLDGSLDTTFDGDGIVTTNFGPDHFSYAQAVAIDADGKIVVTGAAVIPSPTGGWVVDLAVARYQSNGTLDTSFGGGDGLLWTDFGYYAYDNGTDVAIQPDGKIIVAGYAGDEYYARKFTVGRYLSDGTLDPSFASDGKVVTPILNSAEPESVDIQSDGKIVVSGRADGGAGWVIALARYNTDGSLDESFGVVANGEPDAVDDSAATAVDTAVTVDVLANDSDPDTGDILTVTSLGTPGAGTAVDNGDGTVTYTPNAGYVGLDSFTYTVSDGNGGEDTATATITIQEQSAEPVYTSTDGPILIGDLKTVTSTVLATFDDPIVALNVRINLTHADAANLDVRLLDPTGDVSLNLASSLDSGDLYYGVEIEGASPQHIGTWTLEITDSAKDKKRGTLYGWSLIVNPTAPLAVAASSQTASAADLALLSWFDLDQADDDETDPLTESLVDDLALMLV